jgi:hypothetical protein
VAPAALFDETAKGRLGQSLYPALLKELLNPALRELGFIGSNGRYALRCHRCRVLLSLQKSTYSTASEVRFTVNLTVVNKTAWAEARTTWPHLPERPSSATTRYVSWAPHERLGRLAPEAADKWWLIGCHPT